MARFGSKKNLNNTPNSKENLTPMLAQYHTIKEQYPDAILLFRLGDFYEMFYEDAEIASRVLNIVLTTRPAGRGKRIPMAGIPHHALNSYVHRLIHSGYKVAICEQVEDASQAKGIVKREVVRVITPGTFFERETSGLMALYPVGRKWAVGYLNLAVGEFFGAVLPKEEALNVIAKLQPGEILLPKGKEELANEIKPLLKEVYFTYLPTEEYFGEVPKREFLEHFKIPTLKVLQFPDDSVLPALAALLKYAKHTQKSFMPFVRRPKPYVGELFAKVDLKAQKSLELLESLDGKKAYSLFGVLDRTQTGMGRRKLKFHIVHPYKDINRIKETQDAVAFLVENPQVRTALRKLLEKTYDMERLVSKISSSMVNAKDLVMLKQSLFRAVEIKQLLEEKTNSSLLLELAKQMDNLSEVAEDIDRTLVDDPPYQVKEGGLIKDGVDPYLDELRRIKNNAQEWILKYQEKLRKETGISSLKIGYNKVMGFYIEITKPNIRYVQDWIERGLLRRRQTLKSSERFVTQELQEFEEKFLSAEEKIKNLEYQIFTKLRERVLEKIDRIGNVASLLGEIDYLQSLATVAVENFWVRPTVEEKGIETKVVGGRHPVIEKYQKVYIPNDLTFNEKERLLIITGPNAAGKSSYIRQTAIIFLLAQMGSFVPASEAKLSIVDAIYTRIGSGDILALGVSTFMNEMYEVANILTHATEKSLIVLDEVGRGTATYDGIAVATAVAEYIAKKIKARTLFATHYHELTELEGKVEGVVNYHMEVRETPEGDIEFLYSLKRGPANKSFGVNVAKMAGLPPEVVERAKEILSLLEAQKTREFRTIEGLKQEIAPTYGTDKKPTTVRKPYQKPNIEALKINRPKERKKYVSPKIEKVKTYSSNGNGNNLSREWETIKKLLKEVDIARTTPLDALLKLARLKDLID
ncbi:MAG: DNA mismatch repair protein MutS [Aquificae bacterium]|nr:DNA mismatch repair protein MutS [Aquificota bacterium]